MFFSKSILALATLVASSAFVAAAPAVIVENIVFNPIHFKPTLQDSWLSGFATAESSFIAGVVNQKSNKQFIDSEGNIGVKETIYQLVRIRFVLDQKDETILLHIKNLLGVGIVQKTSDPGVFRYSVVSFKSNSFIVDYFSAFYLKGKKQSAFLKWKFIRDLLLEKKHLESGGIEKIKEMAQSINN